MLLMFLQVIPEFFQSSGEFLLNSQNLPLGFKQDKTKVMDVELPSWAKGIASKVWHFTRSSGALVQRET